MNNLKMTIASGTLLVMSALGVAAAAVGTSAQTPAQSTPGTAVQTPVAGATTVPVQDDKGQMPGGPGGRGGHMGGGFDGPGGFDGRGGPGMGGPGGDMGATSDGATRSISNTTSVITLVKSDLAYATGKMDTAAVEGYLKTADSLLASAQSALTASQFGKAAATAEAARDLAQVADSLMAQALGADKLPSYSQRPMHPGGDMMNSTVTITQAQASRVLARTYNDLVVQATLLKNAGNVAEASSLLTQAQNAYKQAYDLYSAGKYIEAVTSSRLANQLAHVAGDLVNAATVPANADTPVTVPSPNF